MKNFTNFNFIRRLTSVILAVAIVCSFAAIPTVSAATSTPGTVIINAGLGKFADGSKSLRVSIDELDIGTRIDLENPSYQFGYGFEGWYTDSALTQEFAEKYYTESHVKNGITLYAGYSQTHFSFEGYVKSSQYGFGDYFYDIETDADFAYDGNTYFEYHYTSEYYNQPYDENNLYTIRRTQKENTISIKNLKSNTDYIISYRYKMPKDSGKATLVMLTRGTNIWAGELKEYTDTKRTLNADNCSDWTKDRIVFNTGTLASGSETLFFHLYASANVDTVVYLDDIRVEEVSGDTRVTTAANAGTFADGSTTKEQTIVVGNKISELETPYRENYDFDGWYYDSNCTDPYKNEVIDITACANNLYAGWTTNMGFESYYYDLNASNRNEYISNTVSITNEDSKSGVYSAKVVNSNSSQQNVIALNPLHNNTRYLVTFYYKANSLSAPVNIKFASMGYNINNTNEVQIYEPTYTITTSEAGSGYKMGSLIINTNYKSNAFNRFAMLISSDTASNYTIFIDSIELTVLSDDQGYIIFADESTGNYISSIGNIGETVKTFQPEKEASKFIGWHTDSALTTIYNGNYTYGDTANYLYAKWINGQNYNSYTPTSMAIGEEYGNKFLTASAQKTETIGRATRNKKYAIEFEYSLISATGTVNITIGGVTQAISTNEVGTGWINTTFVVTPTSTANLTLKVAGATGVTFQIRIDNLIFYEVPSNMVTVTFDQDDNYATDCVRVGVPGTAINMPNTPANATHTFYGWYKDSNKTTVITNELFPTANTTYYAKWASNPVSFVTFDDLGTSLPSNSGTVNASLSTTKKDGTYAVDLDKSPSTDRPAYLPLSNKNGYVTLESNATYAISFFYRFHGATSSSTVNINFFTGSQSTKGTKALATSDFTASYERWSWRVGYVSFTTGTISASNNILYLAITESGVQSHLYIDTIKITRVDSGRNHIFGVDIAKNNVLYEITGNCGEKINYPNINDLNYEVEGWYYDNTFTNIKATDTHDNQRITTLYCRFDLADINFDNYLFENVNSRYTVGEDISLTTEERFDTLHSLKYDYKYAHNYFETTNNAAALGKVSDNNTYRISFRYKLTAAQSDVDVKFLTANLQNRWAFVTNYDKATYTVYSTEIGNSWKEAVVYLTTDFQGMIGASGLYMTFNPKVEGQTTLYIDDVRIDLIRPTHGVVAFLGNNGHGVEYVRATVGSTVSAPSTIPAAQFASFNGWYANEALTQKFTSTTAKAGITYVYSSWNQLSENFDNYIYESNSSEAYSSSNVIENGVLTYTAKGNNVFEGFRIGELKNNTSYAVSFSYKTNTAGTTINFASANSFNINSDTAKYTDQGNFLTVSSENADGAWHQGKVYITTSFAYSIPNDSNINNASSENVSFGNMLYGYFGANSGTSVSIDNISIKEVSAVYEEGVSVLVEEAAETVQSQALRFYFSYETPNSVTVDIDGQNMTLIERGIIYKNARNSVTGVTNGNTVTVTPITLSCKDLNGYGITNKTNKFNEYWDYNSQEQKVVYSGYVSGFYLNDIRFIAARGYIKVKDENGNIYTFYSADKKTNVKENVDKNSEITDKKVHTINNVSWEQYRIVHKKTMPYIYGKQIANLISYAKETHKFNLPRVTEKATETQYEIIIGDTTRKATDLVELPNENEYSIEVHGTKLIIRGGSDLATMQAVADLIELFKLKDSLKCGADLYDGFVKTGTIVESEDNYALSFNDDFNASTLNREYWLDYGGQNIANPDKNYSQYTSCLGGVGYRRAASDTEEDQKYVDANGITRDALFIRDGNAVLTCARLDSKNFTSASMSTFYTMNFQYGIFEAKVKLSKPSSNQSIWINGGGTDDERFIKYFGREYRDCMTEFDVLENFGKTNHYASNVHYWWNETTIYDTGHSSLDSDKNAAAKNQTYVPDADETGIYDNYHTFAMDWENDKVSFAFDGIKYYEYQNNSKHYNRAANYLIISNDIGQNGYGVGYDINKDDVYFETLLDYVRIYQIQSMGSRINFAKK